MANDNVLYCRFCAEIKGANKLIDLQCDYTKKQEITDKLVMINVTFLDLHLSDKLPKTMCFICNDSLDKALQFVSQMKNAQIFLQQLFYAQAVKEETNTKHAALLGNGILEGSSLEVELKPKSELKEEYDYASCDNDTNFESKLSASSRLNHKKRKKANMKAFQEVLDVFDENNIPLSRLKCMTWKDYPWLCSYCNSQFFTLEELKTHSMGMHNSCMPFKCIDCESDKKKTLKRFISHVSKHKKHLQLCCHICNEEFLTKYELNLHKCSDSTMACNGCNTSFEDYDQLREHMSNFYNKKVKMTKYIESSVSCEVCSKTFANRGNLNKHQQIHTERSREQTCEKCGKRFYDKGTLSSHMMLHEDSRKFKCEICKSNFRTASQLRAHVGIHGGPRPYSCEQCGRTFRLPTHLKSHLIIHTDSLPHICEYCSKRFRFKTILTQHLRQHTGVKPYCCEHCLREFTNWPNYNKHMKRRHRIDTSKKKHTPEGVFPVNPLTGEILPLPDSSHSDEWKKKVMVPKPRGRPKAKDISNNSETNNSTESEMKKDPVKAA